MNNYKFHEIDLDEGLEKVHIKFKNIIKVKIITINDMYTMNGLFV